jgi:hypothetical protein
MKEGASQAPRRIGTIQNQIKLGQGSSGPRFFTHSLSVSTLTKLIIIFFPKIISFLKF